MRYSEKHGKEAHERHREEDALYEARRDEEDRKLRKLMHAMGREPSTPTPLKCSYTAPTAPSPDSVLYPPDPPPLSSLSGEASKTTKNRRPSSGPRKTHGHSLHTAGISLPLADPPSPPNGTPVPLLHHQASAGRLPRPRRTDGHPAALGRRTATPYLLPASTFHSRTPPLPRTALPFIHPPLSRESPGLTK